MRSTDRDRERIHNRELPAIGPASVETEFLQTRCGLQGAERLDGGRVELPLDDEVVDLDRPVITSCGSGVTAAILTLGQAELGRSSRL